ncbi:MAG: Trm112 family protein [Desulfatiglandales bacterium]
MIDKKLLEILACPKCKGDVELVEEMSGLVCRNCKLLYEIKDGIPVMLIDKAVPLTDQRDKDQII